MKFRSTLILAAVLSTLALAGCKKPPEPQKTPEPKAEAQAEDSSAAGKTTTFENPPAEP